MTTTVYIRNAIAQLFKILVVWLSAFGYVQKIDALPVNNNYILFENFYVILFCRIQQLIVL